MSDFFGGVYEFLATASSSPPRSAPLEEAPLSSVSGFKDSRPRMESEELAIRCLELEERVTRLLDENERLRRRNAELEAMVSSHTTSSVLACRQQRASSHSPSSTSTPSSRGMSSGRLGGVTETRVGDSGRNTASSRAVSSEGTGGLLPRRRVQRCAGDVGRKPARHATEAKKTEAAGGEDDSESLALALKLHEELIAEEESLRLARQLQSSGEDLGSLSPPHLSPSCALHSLAIALPEDDDDHLTRVLQASAREANVADENLTYEDMVTWENVRPGLSRELLNEHTLVSVVRSRSELPSDCKQCPICMDDFAEGDHLRRLPCLHVFHAPCVDKHFEHSKVCPICQREIPDGPAS